jgi:hypothetical protein
MRQLLSGIAVAALLATGLPVIAQAADADARTGATMAPDTAGQAGTMKAKHHRQRHDAMMQERRGSSADDTMADQLNRQELQQLGQASSGAATSTGSSTAPRQ